MTCEWRETTLRAAGVILLDCERRTPPPAEEGYPYIAIPQIKHGRLDLTDVRRISREHFTDWIRKTRPRPDDAIVSRRCNPGESAFVPQGLECALGQNLVLLRADGSHTHSIVSLRWLVRVPTGGSKFRPLSTSERFSTASSAADIPNFRLPIPPLREQRAIAHILGTLDDKIELNRRMNETLEAMARAIFKSWFVDFDPVRAKAEGRDPACPNTSPTSFPTVSRTPSWERFRRGGKFARSMIVRIT